jgi:saccharopine dehydrogenase-like NADP-dependent oxidoreductase
MGYKFSWAPRGVVLAWKNPARFLKDGKIVDVPGPRLFAHHWPCAIAGFGELEVYPNRDSLPYIESYGIPSVESMFRGTLRYPGWCDTLQAIVDLGILDETERTDLVGFTFAQWTGRLLGMAGKATALDLARRLGRSADVRPVTDLVWLGLVSDDPLPKEATTYLDVLAQRMLSKMQYAPGERDMLVMQHEFVVRYDDRTEKTLSTMVDYGIPRGDTSMSRLVGLPAAIAARMILQGEIDLTGVQVPMVPAIYEPVLEELATLGVRFTETTSVL